MTVLLSSSLNILAEAEANVVAVIGGPVEVAISTEQVPVPGVIFA